MTEPVAGTRATYDVVAADYQVRWSRSFDALDEAAEAFRARVGPGALVADVGCGPGRDLGLLRGLGLRAFGFDLSLGMLRAGGLPGVAEADMRRLPIRAGALDGLWCAAALLHVPLVDTPTVLAGFARVLRPGGALFLLVAEGDGEGWQEDGAGRARWYAHHREGPLSAALATAGLHVTRVDRHVSHRDWLHLHAEKG